MHRFAAILLILSLCSVLFAQQQPGNKNSNNTTNTTGNNTAGDKKTQDEKTASKIPEGYGDITWGTYLSDAKSKIKGKLTYTDEKKIIISNDGELQYYYGFFYADPAMTTEEKILGEEKKPDNTGTGSGTGTNTNNIAGNKTEPEKKDEGKLFYVSLKFPYLAKDAVYEKIKAKYGEHTKENLKNNQGAYIWDSEKTLLLMWVDNYEKKPFSRRIIFMSKDVAKDLNKYTNDMFFKKELELIKKVNP